MLLATKDQVERLANIVDEGRLSKKLSLLVLSKMNETGKDPETIIEEEGLVHLDDRSGFRRIIQDYVAKQQHLGRTNEANLRALLKLIRNGASPQFVQDELNKAIKGDR